MATANAIPVYYVGGIGYSKLIEAEDRARQDSKNWPGERVTVWQGYQGVAVATFINGRKSTGGKTERD